MQFIDVASEGKLPSIGLGLWKVDRSSAPQIVAEAIQMGYRHLDCACDYGNESEVGEGIQLAFQRGYCSRSELWVTSKLWNTYHRAEHVRPALERSLRDLKLDYLDLYLIHFPISLAYVPFDQRYPPGWMYDPKSAQPRMVAVPCSIQETWQAMEDVQRAGLTKYIGISNFSTALIRDVLSYAAIRPAVLQVESHPYLVQPKLLRYCNEEQIAFTAFSPLGAGSYVPLGMAKQTDSILADPIILGIAETHQRSPAQIVLRWGVQRGTAVIPKSSNPDHLRENLSIFDFSLSDAEMNLIQSLDRHQRFNDPGVFCELAFGCYYPIYD